VAPALATGGHPVSPENYVSNTQGDSTSAVTTWSSGNLPHPISNDPGHYLLVNQYNCVNFVCSGTYTTYMNSATDTLGNTFYRCGGNGGNDVQLSNNQFYAKITTSGTDSVTLHSQFDSNTYGNYIEVVEVEGISPDAVCRSSNYSTQAGATTTPAIGTLNPVACGQFVWGMQLYGTASSASGTPLHSGFLGYYTNTNAIGISTLSWVTDNVNHNLVIGSLASDDTCNEGVKYYIDCVNGNDSNSGTDTSHPWKHAPGMAGQSGGPASLTPGPSDSLIFRKGITCDHTFFRWSWPSGARGTDGREIYIGTQDGWNNGDDSARAVFDGEFTHLASGVNMVDFSGDVSDHPGDYINFGNGIEMKRFQAYARSYHAMLSYSCMTHFHVDGILIHDWDFDPADDPVSSTTIHDSACSECESRDGFHGGIIGYYNNNSCPATDAWIQNSEIHNSEGKDRGWQNGGAIWGGNVRNSSVHDAQTGLDPGVVITSTFHDLNNGSCPGPSRSETVPGSNRGFTGCGREITNGFQPFHDDATYIQFHDYYSRAVEDANGFISIYGNHFYNIDNSAAAIFLNGAYMKAYVYNNLLERIPVSSALGLDMFEAPPQPIGVTSAELHFFNNTIEETAGQPALFVQGRGSSIVSVFEERNNHIISDDQGDCNCNTAYNPDTAIISNNVYNSVSDNTYHPLASLDGYTQGNFWAPSVSTAPTVGVGLNLTSRSLTSISPAYNGNRRPTSGAWDVGAYQFTDYPPTSGAMKGNLIFKGNGKISK
jgi:hypothetical protein